MISDYDGNPTIKIVGFHRSLFPYESENNIYAPPDEKLSPLYDYWSIGVLLYVMLTGRDPFQKKNIAIVENEEEMFPWDEWRYISCCSKDLLKNILKLDPKERFDAEQIKNHPWLHNIGNLPS